MNVRFARFRLVALLLIAVFTACSRTVHIPVPNGTPLRVVAEHYNAATGVAEPTEVLVQPNASEYKRMQDWVTRNQDGWYQSLATNGPDGIYVYAGDLRLQFSGRTVWVFTGKGHFQKEVRENDYAFLKSLVGM